jgi:acetyltransferase-like isoleucine patch superfamily enzyme
VGVFREGGGLNKKRHMPDWVEIGEGAQIHPSVVFMPYQDKKTSIGKRTKIDSGSVIYGGVKIGNDSIVGHNTVVRFNTKVGVHSIVANLCMMEGNITMGDHSLITSNSHIAQKTTIGSYVFLSSLSITTNDREMLYYREGYSRETGTHWRLLQGPTIKDGARVAVGVVIFPSITIGKQAVVGAGSIVTKDVPDYAVVYGTPATIKRFVDPRKDVIMRCSQDHS